MPRAGRPFCSAVEVRFGTGLQPCHTMAVIMVTISSPNGSFHNENGNSANSRDLAQFFTSDPIESRFAKRTV